MGRQKAFTAFIIRLAARLSMAMVGMAALITHFRIEKIGGGGDFSPNASRAFAMRQFELKFVCACYFRHTGHMRNLMTSRGCYWPILLIFAGGFLSGPVSVQGDIIERSYGDSNGQKSATGFVLQGSRNMKKLGKRRSISSSVILPPLTLEKLSRIEPEVSVVPARPQPPVPKPRFGYGSDYHSDGASKEVREPQFANPAPGGVSVDPATSIRFLPVRQNRTYHRRLPFYGFSSNPYFYRPGTLGRYYLNSPGCYGGGFFGGTSFNVYHGGNLTYSSWNHFIR